MMSSIGDYMHLMWWDDLHVILFLCSIGHDPAASLKDMNIQHLEIKIKYYHRLYEHNSLRSESE